MTREEAIEHGKEQLLIFGGEHREFIEISIKALDNLDKIKAEIIEKSITDCELHGCGTDDLLIDTSEALAIIDKYTAGSEG